MSCEENVFHIVFEPKFYEAVAREVKILGIKRVELQLLAQGFTELQVKIILKRVMKKYGW